MTTQAFKADFHKMVVARRTRRPLREFETPEFAARSDARWAAHVAVEAWADFLRGDNPNESWKKALAYRKLWLALNLL